MADSDHGKLWGMKDGEGVRGTALESVRGQIEQAKRALALDDSQLRLLSKEEATPTLRRIEDHFVQ